MSKYSHHNITLARIHRKKEKLLLHFSRNYLAAARRFTAPVRKFTKSPYTNVELDYVRVLTNFDDKKLALLSKRQSVSGRF